MTVNTPDRRGAIVCDAIIGNVSSSPAARFHDKSPDPLPLAWLDCTRRAFRKTTAGGREIALLLPVGSTLCHGDVLHEEESFYVVVDLLPCDLLLITSSDRAALGRVALELGNLHAPVEVTSEGGLLTPPDGPTRGILRRNGVDAAPYHQRFTPLRATVTSRLSMAEAQQVMRARM